MCWRRGELSPSKSGSCSLASQKSLQHGTYALFFSRDSHSSYGARGDLRRHAGSCPPHPYAKVMGVLLNTVFSGLGGSRFVIFCILKSVLCILPLHQKLKPQRKDATSSLQGSHCSISRAFELEAPLPTPQSTAATQVCPFHFS